MNRKREIAKIFMDSRRIQKEVKAIVQYCNRYSDAGVKGMKKGQHVMARDPEYVEQLKGGGASSTPKPSSSASVKPSAKQKPSKLQKAKGIAKGIGRAALAGAGALAAGMIVGRGTKMLAGKLLGKLGGKAVAKAVPKALPKAAPKALPKPAPKAITKAVSKAPRPNPSSISSLENTKSIQKALSNPNHVWEI